MAAAVAVKNGLDVECGSSFMSIPEAVKSGLLDEKDLDRNLLRVLTERFRTFVASQPIPQIVSVGYMITFPCSSKSQHLLISISKSLIATTFFPATKIIVSKI